MLGLGSRKVIFFLSSCRVPALWRRGCKYVGDGWIYAPVCMKRKSNVESGIAFIRNIVSMELLYRSIYAFRTKRWHPFG